MNPKKGDYSCVSPVLAQLYMAYRNQLGMVRYGTTGWKEFLPEPLNDRKLLLEALNCHSPTSKLKFFIGSPSHLCIDLGGNP